MAEQRQPFRFRLPWLSAMNAAPPPRPTPEPQPSRPTLEIQAPAQLTTTIPFQRPPFRPAGIAPTQPPPQAQTTPRTEPQPSPPSRAATESRIASQPASPSRAAQTRATSVPPESRVTSQPASPSNATQTRAASVPPPESRVTSQTVSPSRRTTQTPITSQSRSPSRAATQSRAASVPSSPSRTAQSQPVIQAGPQPRSPSRLAPQSTGQTSSQTSSPMRKDTQVQPTGRVVSQSLYPLKKSEPSTKETSQHVARSLSSVSQERETIETTQPPLNITHPLSSASQEKESKPAESLQLSQEAQPKTQIKSEIVSESQFQTGGDTTLKPEMVTAQPMTTVALTSRVTPQAPAGPENLETVPITAGHPGYLTESEKKMKEDKGKKDREVLVTEAKPENGMEVARELVKEEKTDSSADEKMQKTITELLTAASGLERPSKELLGAGIKTEERKQEKHEFFGRKKPLATSKSDENHIKAVSSSHTKDMNILGNHQKPDISNVERAPLHKEIKEDISKFVHKLAIGHSKQPVDDRPVSIITVAGENRGASMQLGTESAKKEGYVPIHRGYKLRSVEIPETTTDGEGSSLGRSTRDPTTEKDQATRSYINSNTQSINNSIMFNSSVSERNPGVHQVFSHNPAELTKSTTKQGTLETHNATFSVTPAEKLTYQPIIRRRCLRGLFMEPSDSDPDNPEKPRRHGCLYNCWEKSKDKDIGVL